MAIFSSLDAPKKSGALAIFCRAPRLGTVKTRLAQTRGDEFALGLYRAMLADTFALSVALAPAIETFACFTPMDGFEGEGSLAELWDGPKIAQCEGDLGDRMLDCFAQLRQKGFERIVIIGADSPDLPLQRLRKAFTVLQEGDLTVGPSNDGGFYLIGASVPLPDSLFGAVAWGGDAVYRQLLWNLKGSLGLAFSNLPTWRDVDDEADVKALQRRIFDLGSHAPQTREFLEVNP